MRFSVIIPAYNVELYLSDCLDSLLCQDIDLEIIIIEDGSTDRTRDIAERYQENNKNILVVHQTNKGLSAARNKGLDLAKGEYIVFVDSDDWIAQGILPQLYKVAIDHDADMVMGNSFYQYPDGSKNIIAHLPSSIKYRAVAGEACFISMMEAHSYYPMVWNYIYKNSWIKKNNLRFDKGIIHEDEVWMPIALSLADCVVITDLDFYHYRIREGSIMHSPNRKKSLQSYFYVIERLNEWKGKRKDPVWMSLFYLNIYRIIATVSKKKVLLNDSTFKMPEIDHKAIYGHIPKYLPESAGERCQNYYLTIKIVEEQYLKWKNNIWDTYISLLSDRELQEKKIVLVYNNPHWHSYGSLHIEGLPSDFVISFDRKYQEQAYAIIFYLPDLGDHLEEDLGKNDNQIWVAWATNNEGDESWKEDDDFRDLFNIWMDYSKMSNSVFFYDTDLIKEEKITILHPFTILCDLLNKK